MAYPAHRQDDDRICGATTVVVGQTTVFVNGKLWAVEDDINTHGNGQLINSGTTIFIEGKNVIVHQPDNSQPDDLCGTLGDPHCNSQTGEGSPNVFAYS